MASRYFFMMVDLLLNKKLASPSLYGQKVEILGEIIFESPTWRGWGSRYALSLARQLY